MTYPMTVAARPLEDGFVPKPVRCECGVVATRVFSSFGQIAGRPVCEECSENYLQVAAVVANFEGGVA